GGTGRPRRRDGHHQPTNQRGSRAEHPTRTNEQHAGSTPHRSSQRDRLVGNLPIRLPILHPPPPPPPSGPPPPPHPLAPPPPPPRPAPPAPPPPPPGPPPTPPPPPLPHNPPPPPRRPRSPPAPSPRPDAVNHPAPLSNEHRCQQRTPCSFTLHKTHCPRLTSRTPRSADPEPEPAAPWRRLSRSARGHHKVPDRLRGRGLYGVQKLLEAAPRHVEQVAS